MPAPDSPIHRRLTGTRLGRYMVGPALGSGATATVYLARLDGPEGFERVLALKAIHEHLFDQREFLDQFLDEAKLAVRLSHPNVVHVYEFGRDGDQLFLALEYLHGQTLANVYQRLLRTKARLPCDVIAWLGARAAEGLQHAHMLTDDHGVSLGLVHRDVSPQNLFVTYDGQIKIIDFGIARAEGRLAQTAQGKIRGKFRYMAPEQLLGGDLDHRVDIFALGATLYEVSVNAALFDGKDLTDVLAQIVDAQIPDPRQRRDDMPGALASTILKALSADPGDRQASAADLARELDGFVATSGRSDQKEQLAHQMAELFPEELAAHNKALAEVRTVQAPVEGLASLRPTSDETEAPPSGQVTSRVRVRSMAWEWSVRIAIVLGAAAVLGIVLIATTDHPDPVNSPPAVAASVTLDIRVQPSVEAAVKIQGRVVEQRPTRAQVPRGTDPIDVEVLAQGYDRAVIKVIPDRDQFIVVPLVKAAPAPSAAPSAVPDVPVRLQPPAPTGSPHAPPTAKPPPSSTAGSGIEKQYPD